MSVVHEIYHREYTLYLLVICLSGIFEVNNNVLYKICPLIFFIDASYEIYTFWIITVYIIICTHV